MCSQILFTKEQSQIASIKERLENVCFIAGYFWGGGVYEGKLGANKVGTVDTLNVSVW